MPSKNRYTSINVRIQQWFVWDKFLNLVSQSCVYNARQKIQWTDEWQLIRPRQELNLFTEFRLCSRTIDALLTTTLQISDHHRGRALYWKFTSRKRPRLRWRITGWSFPLFVRCRKWPIGQQLNKTVNYSIKFKVTHNITANSSFTC